MNCLPDVAHDEDFERFLDELGSCAQQAHTASSDPVGQTEPPVNPLAKGCPGVLVCSGGPTRANPLAQGCPTCMAYRSWKNAREAKARAEYRKDKRHGVKTVGRAPRTSVPDEFKGCVRYEMHKAKRHQATKKSRESPVKKALGKLVANMTRQEEDFLRRRGIPMPGPQETMAGAWGFRMALVKVREEISQLNKDCPEVPPPMVFIGAPSPPP